MKNFKKVLALVLAVATVFSFAAMANAAEVAFDDLTDTATLTHKEAVQVLTGLGVIQGFEDKTIRGNDGVSRVQMAKMVGFIMNDGDDVNDLYKGACSFADSKDNWGAGYIAYCASQGIVSGKSADVFDPNAGVTGVEAAKMLLCGLGYDANVEKFVGADWSNNVLNTAKKAGLLEDLTQAKMTLPLNRDDAAQMIFNALQALEVEYDGNTDSVKIGDVVISSNANREYVTDRTGAYVMWYEEHFNDTKEDKVLSRGIKTDAFGVESLVWYYGKDNNHDDVEIAKTITEKATFSGSMTADELYATVGKLVENVGTNYDFDELKIVLDGVTAPGSAFKSGSAFTAADVNNSVGRANKVFYADEITVYMDDDWYRFDPAGNRAEYNLVQVVGKNYYVGQVDDHVVPKNANDNEYISIVGCGNQNDGDFETTAFTDADVDDETKVLFTFSEQNGGEIQSVKKISAVASGAVTKVYTDDDDNQILVADGKQYTVSNNCTVAFDIDGEYDLYLDPKGQILFAEETVAGSNDFYMVMAKSLESTASLDSNDDVYKVRLLGSDGKTADYEVAEINGVKTESAAFDWAAITAATKAFEDMNIATDAATGTIVTYKLNNKGQAKLTVEASTETVGAANADYDDLTEITTVLTGITADGDSDFVVITLDANDEYVYTPISGISALKTAFGNYDYFTRRTVADDDTGNAAVTFVFAEDRASVSKKTVFTNLGISARKSFSDANGDHSYYVVNAVEGSEIKTLKIDADYYDSTVAANFANSNFYVATSYAVDEDGFITKITTADAAYSNSFAFANDAITYNSGVLNINGNAYVNDNVKVYIYDADDEAFKTKSVSSLRNRDVNVGNEVVYVLNSVSSSTTKTVTAIFTTYADN